jgi:hypothetical protein
MVDANAALFVTMLEIERYIDTESQAILSCGFVS